SDPGRRGRARGPVASRSRTGTAVRAARVAPLETRPGPPGLWDHGVELADEVVDLDLLVTGLVPMAVDLPQRPEALEAHCVARFDHSCMRRPDVEAAAMRRR